jgi:hypothetical protein
MLFVGHDIGAGSASLAGAHQLVAEGVVRICGDLSEEYLVAGHAFRSMRALEDNMFIVIAKVCFRIVSAEGELADVPEMPFIAVTQGIIGIRPQLRIAIVQTKKQGDRQETYFFHKKQFCAAKLHPLFGITVDDCHKTV